VASLRGLASAPEGYFAVADHHRDPLCFRIRAGRRVASMPQQRQPRQPAAQQTAEWSQENRKIASLLEGKPDQVTAKL
jgi:hypothetical protein